MANTTDLLGALLRRGMSGSSKSRVEHSLGEKGGLGDLLGQLGMSPPAGQGNAGGGAMDILGSIAGAFQGGSQGTSGAGGGIGDLLGSLVGGGGGGPAKQSAGGGALALLGSMALKALTSASQQGADQHEINPAAQLAAGLRAPETPQEETEVEAIADLTVKAMVNAAKADGRIDEVEMQKVVGEMQEDGISDAEREYVLAEVRKPLNTEELVRSVPNRQVAAQIYAASLLAIEVDTPAEKAYLQKLASDLGLDSRVVHQLHATVGMA